MMYDSACRVFDTQRAGNGADEVHNVDQSLEVDQRLQHEHSVVESKIWMEGGYQAAKLDAADDSLQGQCNTENKEQEPYVEVRYVHESDEDDDIQKPEGIDENSDLPPTACEIIMDHWGAFHIERRKNGRADHLPVSVFGSFTILEQIGQGGMGTVWIVTKNDEQCDSAAGYPSQKFALKTIHAKSTKRLNENWMEISILESLQGSPYIIDIYSRGIHLKTRCIFLMMELATGDFRRYMKKRQKDGKHFDLDEILLLWYQMVGALSHVHKKQILHLDLKPENFLTFNWDSNKVGKFPDENVLPRLKLADFGHAMHVRNSRSHTSITDPGGTLMYRAPESFMPSVYDYASTRLGQDTYRNPRGGNGDRSQDNEDYLYGVGSVKLRAAADLWALGTIAYELSLGVVPFHRVPHTRFPIVLCTPGLRICFPLFQEEDFKKGDDSKKQGRSESQGLDTVRLSDAEQQSDQIVEIHSRLYTQCCYLMQICLQQNWKNRVGVEELQECIKFLLNKDGNHVSIARSLLGKTESEMKKEICWTADYTRLYICGIPESLTSENLVSGNLVLENPASENPPSDRNVHDIALQPSDSRNPRSEPGEIDYSVGETRFADLYGPESVRRDAYGYHQTAKQSAYHVEHYLALQDTWPTSRHVCTIPVEVPLAPVRIEEPLSACTNAKSLSSEDKSSSSLSGYPNKKSSLTCPDSGSKFDESFVDFFPTLHGTPRFGVVSDSDSDIPDVDNVSKGHGDCDRVNDFVQDFNVHDPAYYSVGRATVAEPVTPGADSTSPTSAPQIEIRGFPVYNSCSDSLLPPVRSTLSDYIRRARKGSYCPPQFGIDEDETKTDRFLFNELRSACGSIVDAMDDIHSVIDAEPTKHEDVLRIEHATADDHVLISEQTIVDDHVLISERTIADDHVLISERTIADDGVFVDDEALMEADTPADSDANGGDIVQEDYILASQNGDSDRFYDISSRIHVSHNVHEDVNVEASRVNSSRTLPAIVGGTKSDFGSLDSESIVFETISSKSIGFEEDSIRSIGSIHFYNASVHSTDSKKLNAAADHIIAEGAFISRTEADYIRPIEVDQIRPDMLLEGSVAMDWMGENIPETDVPCGGNIADANHLIIPVHANQISMPDRNYVISDEENQYLVDDEGNEKSNLIPIDCEEEHAHRKCLPVWAIIVIALIAVAIVAGSIAGIVVAARSAVQSASQSEAGASHGPGGRNGGDGGDGGIRGDGDDASGGSEGMKGGISDAGTTGSSSSDGGAPDLGWGGILPISGSPLNAGSVAPPTESSSPTTESSSPTTESSPPATGSNSPTTGSNSPTTGSSPSATGSTAQTTESRAPATGSSPSATGSTAPTTESGAPATGSSAPATENPPIKVTHSPASGGQRPTPVSGKESPAASFSATRKPTVKPSRKTKPVGKHTGMPSPTGKSSPSTKSRTKGSIIVPTKAGALISREEGLGVNCTSCSKPGGKASKIPMVPETERSTTKSGLSAKFRGEQSSSMPKITQKQDVEDATSSSRKSSTSGFGKGDAQILPEGLGVNCTNGSSPRGKASIGPFAPGTGRSTTKLGLKPNSKGVVEGIPWPESTQKENVAPKTPMVADASNRPPPESGAALAAQSGIVDMLPVRVGSPLHAKQSPESAFPGIRNLLDVFLFMSDPDHSKFDVASETDPPSTKSDATSKVDHPSAKSEAAIQTDPPLAKWHSDATNGIGSVAS